MTTAERMGRLMYDNGRLQSDLDEARIRGDKWREIAERHSPMHYRACLCGALVVGSEGHPCDKCGATEGVIVDVAWAKMLRELERAHAALARTRAAVMVCGANVEACKPYMEHLLKLIDDDGSSQPILDRLAAAERDWAELLEACEDAQCLLTEPGIMDVDEWKAWQRSTVAKLTRLLADAKENPCQSQ